LIKEEVGLRLIMIGIKVGRLKNMSRRVSAVGGVLLGIEVNGGETVSRIYSSDEV
jgi:hypothetical protein